MSEKIKIDVEETGEKLKEFYKKAKVFTKDVGGKISKQAEIQRKNIELLRLNDGIASSYRELGEKSLAYFKKNPPADADIKKIIAAVKSQLASVKSLKAKISRQKKA